MKPKVGIAIAAAILVIALFFLTRGGNVPVRNMHHGYFYDLQTSEVYHYTGSNVAPVTAPSGGVGVRAWVFSCESCENTESHFVGYLQKYTEQAKTVLDAGRQPEGDIEAMMLLRLPEGDESSWVTRNSAQGQQIRDAVVTHCPSANAYNCLP